MRNINQTDKLTFKAKQAAKIGGRVASQRNTNTNSHWPKITLQMLTLHTFIQSNVAIGGAEQCVPHADVTGAQLTNDSNCWQ